MAQNIPPSEVVNAANETTLAEGFTSPELG